MKTLLGLIGGAMVLLMFAAPFLWGAYVDGLL